MNTHLPLNSLLELNFYRNQVKMAKTALEPQKIAFDRYFSQKCELWYSKMLRQRILNDNVIIECNFEHPVWLSLVKYRQNRMRLQKNSNMIFFGRKNCTVICSIFVHDFFLELKFSLKKVSKIWNFWTVYKICTKYKSPFFSFFSQ